MLRHRLATPADLFALHTELAPRYGDDPFLQGELLEFWSWLLASPACVPLIVDDHSGKEPRVAAFRLLAR